MPSAAPRPRPTPRRAPLPASLAALALAAGLTACTPSPDDAPTPSATVSGVTSPGVPTPSAPTPTGSRAAAPASPAPDPTAGPEPTGTVPTPDEHSAVGALAAGFPADLLPLPADADILVSSWAPHGDPGAGQPHDVSLNVRTALAVADVVDLYRAALTAAGFNETVAAPTAGLAAESTYSRSAGAELVTVGVLDGGDARTVSVGGRVRASG